MQVFQHLPETSVISTVVEVNFVSIVIVHMLKFLE